MNPKKELEIINRLLAEEEELYNKRKIKKEEEDKNNVYKELLDDKRYSILGG